MTSSGVRRGQKETPRESIVGFKILESGLGFYVTYDLNLEWIDAVLYNQFVANIV
jgi:hypothetical protein